MASRNEKIQIDIAAKDNASKVIDSLAKKIDGMEADEARITVTAQTDKLEAQLDRAKQKLDGLEGDEATVQARLVGTLEEDLEQANKLLEQLDGQTATVKIDSVGAKQGIDDLGKSADSSKSVLANMIGNTTQDLGALGGVAGGAGVAIGQMGEYIADARASGEGFGSILKNFIGVAGPIAAIGLAMKGITGHFDSIAKTKAFSTAQIKKWTDALREGETLLGAINDELEQTGSIEVQGWAGATDIVPILADLSLKTSDWTTAVQGNAEEQHAFLEAVQAAGASGGQFRDIITALATESENYAAAQEQANDAAAVGADAAIALYDSHQRMPAVLDDNRASLDRHRDALDKDRIAADKAAKELDDMRLANQKLRDDLDKRQAYLNLQTTFDDLKQKGTDTINAVKLGWVDAETATRDFELAQIDAKQEVQNLIDKIGNVPPQTEAEIIALVDAGDLDEAERRLDELANTTINIKFRTVQVGGPIRISSSGGGGGVPVGLMAPAPTAGVSAFAAPMVAAPVAGATTATVTVPEVVVPVRLALPTAAEISRRIGPLHLAVTAALNADRRLAGVRD